MSGTGVTLREQLIEAVRGPLSPTVGDLDSERTQPGGGHRHHESSLALTAGGEIAHPGAHELVSGKVGRHLMHPLIVGRQSSKATAGGTPAAR